MLKNILTLVVLLSCVSSIEAQTEDQLKKIEHDYQQFKSQLSLIMGASVESDSTAKKFTATFPRSLLDIKQVNCAIGISDPFSPPLEAISKAIKRASFIQALKNNCKSFAVIDYFSKESSITNSKIASGYREMAHVFVDSLYDTKNAKIVRHEYLKTGELILTVDFSDCKKSPATAIFEVFKNTKELGAALQKTSQIKIIGSNLIEEEQNIFSIYKVKKRDQALAIKTGDVSANANFSDWNFTYSSYKTKIGIKGGLWAYLMTQLSENILNQGTEKTMHVQSVTDQMHNNQLTQITRMAGFFNFDFKYKSFILGLRNF